MRKAYRRTITLLWHRMQERGAHLTIQHVHSHLEKKTTQTDPKYNERWQLAAADEACEQAHAYPFQTPLPSVLKDSLSSIRELMSRNDPAKHSAHLSWSAIHTTLRPSQYAFELLVSL